MRGGSSSQDYSSGEAGDGVPSDSNSEEIILQKKDSVAATESG